MVPLLLRGLGEEGLEKEDGGIGGKGGGLFFLNESMRGKNGGVDNERGRGGGYMCVQVCEKHLQ